MKLRNLTALICTLAASVPAMAQEAIPNLPVQVSYSYNLDNDLSPDGAEMVYLKFLEGRTQLFIMDANGRNSRLVLDDTVMHEEPDWSPDGQWIAFLRRDGEERRIWLVRPDGTDLRPLSPPGERAIHPSWSRDSRFVIYSTDDDLEPPSKNVSIIYRLEVASGERVVLLDDETRTYPSYSPDGTKIAFRRMVGNNSEVFVADADGSNERNLTDHPAFDGWPEWSPDGSRIAFASNRNSAYQIHVMDADGSNARRVAITEGRATVPRWSPQGDRLYFTNCWHVSLRRACEIFVVPVDD